MYFISFVCEREKGEEHEWVRDWAKLDRDRVTEIRDALKVAVITEIKTKRYDRGIEI